MNDLIAINYENETPSVNGRDLHKALEIETPYHIWFPRMCEYGFIEGKSYCTFLNNRSDGLPGKPLTEHMLSIGMAKELCMLQRNEMGKKFRQYFIEVEEAWNSPDKIMERALLIAHQRAVSAERRIFALSAEKESLKVELNESEKFWTIMKLNQHFKLNWNMKTCQLKGRIASTYSRQHGYEIRKCKTNDDRFESTNSYAYEVLERLFLSKNMGVLS